MSPDLLLWQLFLSGFPRFSITKIASWNEDVIESFLLELSRFGYYLSVPNFEKERAFFENAADPKRYFGGGQTLPLCVNPLFPGVRKLYHKDSIFKVLK